MSLYANRRVDYNLCKIAKNSENNDQKNPFIIVYLYELLYI